MHKQLLFLADKHIYKKHLIPEQYEVYWNKGT
jgi:hypothetical protein